MKKQLPFMYDVPERSLSIAGLFFGVICFYTFPFLALFFSGGFMDAKSQSWFEVVYHGVNFVIVVLLFRGYLKDSFFNVQCNLKPFLKVVFGCVGVMIVYAILFFQLAWSSGSEMLFFTSLGTLPLVEMELFNLTTNLLQLIL